MARQTWSIWRANRERKAFVLFAGSAESKNYGLVDGNARPVIVQPPPIPVIDLVFAKEMSLVSQWNSRKILHRRIRALMRGDEYCPDIFGVRTVERHNLRAMAARKFNRSQLT